MGGCREEFCRSGRVEGGSRGDQGGYANFQCNAMRCCILAALWHVGLHNHKKSLSVFLTTTKYLIISSDLLQDYHIR